MGWLDHRAGQRPSAPSRQGASQDKLLFRIILDGNVDQETPLPAKAADTPNAQDEGSATMAAPSLRARLGQAAKTGARAWRRAILLARAAPGQARMGLRWALSGHEPSLIASALTQQAARTPPPRPRDLMATGAGALGASLLTALGFVLYVTWGMPTPSDVWSAAQSPSYTFVDRNGRVILREGARNAPPVNLASLPPYVAQAVIAIEDRRYYEHLGVDFGGLARAAGANVKAGRVVQGGSTLTQQLAKNLFLNNQRSFRRKAQEVVLALWLEQSFNKRELLALYLSRVYFGAGAFGIEAASERYFDKPARALSLGEAALLAGLLKAPSRLNPIRQPGPSQERARLVLNEMAALDYITPDQRAAAVSAPIVISAKNPSGNLGYFRDWIQPVIEQALGDQRDDFVIQTTLDLDAQREGERVIAKTIAEQGSDRHVSQGALLALDRTGGVRTMVGGLGYEQTQFNRVTQARRQPGSAFKFFIYLTAMENGYSPRTVRNDSPIIIGDWAPGNYEDKFLGPVNLGYAFAHSLNMVAIQLALEVGGKAVIRTARRLGVQSPLHNYRSLALGAQELTLMELTGAYGAMATGGKRLEPHGISEIRRANGQPVWRWSGDEESVIEDGPLRNMNALLSRVVTSGTGRRALIEGREVAGKTGTGNAYRDAWFVGFTSGIVTGVWFGNDDFSPMEKVTGGTLPAQAWHDFMVKALDGMPNEPLLLPEPDEESETVPLIALDGLSILPIADAESPPPTANDAQTVPAAAAQLPSSDG